MTAALALLAWAGLVLGARALLLPVLAEDFRVHVNAPPLVGFLDWRPGSGLLPAAAFGAAAVAWGPRLAATLSWRGLMLATAAAAVLWPVLLAVADGPQALTAPMRSSYEYLAGLARVDSAADLLGRFTERLPAYPTHVQGHPPGFPLLLYGLDRAGLGGARVATGIVIAGGALAAPAALAAARELGGEARARVAAPFVVFAPAAIWIATSADALFMGAGAVGVALVVLATGRGAARARPLALAAGVVLGGALHLSYGVAPLALLVLAVTLGRRRLDVMLVCAAGVLAVFVLFTALGFWWLDGLQATREAHDGGIARRRPYGVFLLVAPAAFAVAVGPAAVAGLARLRGRGLWLLCGAAVAALALSDLSGLSRGETERVWLPFAPWVLVATAALGAAGRSDRRWLALQVALALVLQAWLSSPW